jgi:hypothetical protein
MRGNVWQASLFKEETTMNASATTIRELTAAEAALVGGGDYTWGGLLGHIGAGAVSGGLAGSLVPGLGTATGAVAGGLLGGIEYCMAAAIEQYF